MTIRTSRLPLFAGIALALSCLAAPAHASADATKEEAIAMVKAKPAGAWQEYKFTNPVSKKIEPKVMYCEKLAETAVCGGVYP